MIDISVLRDDPDLLRRGLARRGLDLDVDRLVSLDVSRRSVRVEAEDLRASQRQSGKEIARLEGDEKQAAIARAGELADAYKTKLAEADELDRQFMDLWIRVPNLADESAPDGMTEDDAVEIKRWGEPANRDFAMRDHRELGEALDMIDTERAARLSGTRFGYLMGPAVFIEFGLVRFAFDVLTERGFTPVVPPVLVREQALFGTGFLPDTEQ